MTDGPGRRWRSGSACPCSGRYPASGGAAMTRVLVVHHDLDLADQEADELRRAGFEVEQCGGPVGGRCPVLAGRRCDLAARADVLVYDAWATGEPDGARRLIEGLR